MKELVIVRTAQSAVHAGFQAAGGRHRQLLHVMAWWPGAGLRGLQGHRFERVTVDSGVYRETTGRDRHEFMDACAILRAGQQVFGDAAVWMEF